MFVASPVRIFMIFLPGLASSPLVVAQCAHVAHELHSPESRHINNNDILKIRCCRKTSASSHNVIKNKKTNVPYLIKIIHVVSK